MASSDNSLFPLIGRTQWWQKPLISLEVMQTGMSELR